MDFELPLGSQEDLQKSSFAPLSPGLYVVKIGKIALEKTRVYENGHWSNNKFTWQFTLVASPVARMLGGPMLDEEGGEVLPLKALIFRNLNPLSTKFQKDGTPAMMRSFLCFMLGTPVRDNPVAKNFCLMSAGDNPDLIEDADYKKKWLIESNPKEPSKELVKAGYKALPDIRMYEGEYIGCKIAVDAKGRNKILEWEELPHNFKPDFSQEQLSEFKQSVENMWSKVLAKRGGDSSGSSSQSDSSEDAGEVKIGEVFPD